MQTNGVSIVAFNLSRFGKVSDILLVAIESTEENNNPVFPILEPRYDLIGLFQPILGKSRRVSIGVVGLGRGCLHLSNSFDFPSFHLSFVPPSSSLLHIVLPPTLFPIIALSLPSSRGCWEPSRLI